MIQARQARRVRGKLGQEYVQRGNGSAAQVSKSGISVLHKLGGKQEWMLGQNLQDLM